MLGLSRNKGHCSQQKRQAHVYPIETTDGTGAKSKSISDAKLHPPTRIEYNTMIFNATFKSASAYGHEPWRRMTCSSSFKPLPQTDQLPHLNRPCKRSAVVFICGGGAIIEQRGLIVGHIFI